MTNPLLLAVLVGVGLTAGVLLIARGATGPLVDPDEAEEPSRLTARWHAARREPLDRRRLLITVAVAVLVGLVTRWPVAAVLAGITAWVLPQLVGPDRAGARTVARIEGVATWTESLRDTLAAAAGLEQAIIATAPLAPEAIRGQVQRLAARLHHGDRLPVALRRFAAELDDPIGDLVATALVMAAERHARQIGELLSSLAEAARDQAAFRLRVAAGRTRTRTGTRVIVITTLVMTAGMTAFSPDYMGAYDSVTGQLVLLFVGSLFATGFWWAARMARIGEPERVFATEADTPALGQVPA
ncbi:MAG TPA: type II secretion system F family protein [Pilimelia sp.]|nr:type II secretion system F family protein [Pilimelia sp.]